MARLWQSALTGKKQRVLWLSVVSISVVVPLMILKTSVTTLDFPTLLAPIDTDWKIAAGSETVVSNDTTTRTSTLLNETTGISITSEAVEQSVSTILDSPQPKSTSKSAQPQYHDFLNVEVPFQWCLDYRINKSIDDQINCQHLIAGDKDAIEKAKSWTPPCSFSDKEMGEIACDCTLLKKSFHFDSEPLSEEEHFYPLAYILVVEKNLEQIIRLLSAIYQPQNIYCINYDEHSGAEFKKSIRCLTSCFENLITPSRHVEIFWGDISILDATMACMRLLVNVHKNHDWKYVQILSWNDLPLKTNSEQVKIFNILNGSSDSELTHGQPERFRKFYYQGGTDRTKIGQSRPIPPDGLTIYKGSFAVSLPREFCIFLVSDPVARRLLSYSRPVWAPEEQFWSTLIHNPNLNHNASYPGTCLHYYHLEGKGKNWISRFQIWHPKDCAGYMVSGSCCFGVGDLPMLVSQPGLIAHKFYADYQPAVWYCMLKWHHEKTYNRTAAALYPLNTTYYENLPAVRYHNMANKTEFLC